MANNIITPEFRAVFVSLFKPSKPKNAPETQPPKYSIRAAFPPDTDFTVLHKEIELAISEKEAWQEKRPKNIRSPFRENGELDNPIQGIPDDWIVMTFSSDALHKPGLVASDLQDIIDETQVYSGAWFRAEVRAYAYNPPGNNGVAFGLQNVQKLRDDDPLKAAENMDMQKRAKSAFTAVSGNVFD